MKRSAKRTLAAILSAMLVASAATTAVMPAFAAEAQIVEKTAITGNETLPGEEMQTVAVATWEELKQALEDPTATMVVMTQNISAPDITAQKENEKITVVGKKTLDLAGSELNLCRYGTLLCDSPDDDFTICTTAEDNEGAVLADRDDVVGDEVLVRILDGTFTLASGTIGHGGDGWVAPVLCDGGNFVLTGTGSIYMSGDGGDGVTIQSGTFTMNGGEIVSKKDISTALFISDGVTFIMNDGLIKQSGDWGRTVSIGSNCIAEINGGKIVGDSISGSTLGVGDDSVLKITGGTIRNQGGTDTCMDESGSKMLFVSKGGKILVEGTAFLDNATSTMFVDDSGGEIILRSGKFGGKNLDYPGVLNHLAEDSKLLSYDGAYYGGTDAELSAFLNDIPANATITLCHGATALSLKNSATVLNETKESSTITNISDADITVNGETVKPGESLEIAPSAIDLSEAKIEKLPNYPYTGEKIVPANLTVTLGGKKLNEGIDYKVSASDNIEVGKATVKITPVEGSNFVGEQSRAFIISPPQVKGIKTVKKTKTSIKFQFNAVRGADGYKIYDNGIGLPGTQVRLATVSTQNGAKTLRKTVTGLKAGERRYYVIRAYKIVDGSMRYGPYSRAYLETTAK